MVSTAPSPTQSVPLEAARTATSQHRDGTDHSRVDIDQRVVSGTPVGTSLTVKSYVSLTVKSYVYSEATVDACDALVSVEPCCGTSMRG
jgi:hypothetical protein